ncbi:hypothetical protein QMZ62_23235 [Serratia sp. PF2-63]|uniref:hypothetical protein n=1 Tax=Enterobacterales TaxID=91347 RepID=UPI0024B59DC8|nr:MULTISPECIES: hypothetical protein [Enterobacterales]MDI9223663.1 hypothetical protein [Pantoea sp. EA-12]MDI9265865.1 hypothetical protein [Serratia sp. PF2-63]MDI9267167.1 hypothetical protein [Serratia sp. PF-27]
MKLNMLSPEEMISVVIRHLSGTTLLNESQPEVQLRRFLRGDDGTLAGGLLHLLSMVSQSAKMAAHSRVGEWQPRIEFTGCTRKKYLHLFVIDVWVLSVPPSLEAKNSAGKRIRLSLLSGRS